MSALKVPAAPPGSGRAGKRLWRGVLEAFELQPYELELLREAVRTADQLELLDVVAKKDGPMAETSQGPRVHPAIVESRQLRLTLARLLATLRLPDDQGEVPQRRGAARAPYDSGRAKRAAEARWGRNGA